MVSSSGGDRTHGSDTSGIKQEDIAATMPNPYKRTQRSRQQVVSILNPGKLTAENWIEELIKFNDNVQVYLDSTASIAS